ncbi:transmembrane and ubiquitin-like domain-containing protein 1 [Melanaphis sacchari]|uniref:Transmembrane and ubiquitin-like domain-containing protein 1 n=1 Tax=Melanaphis sacchari TaxID=742174 RepID=A0A2H8TIE8_9HEMI|nr:transmembrane and ubiquitin-like domain-containing protein 1 [Melanaphis sacchari]
MALVEGFGDEVIQFFGILFVVVLIVLLWMSTQVAEMQIFRGAVFILERRTRRRHHDATRVAPVIPNSSISEQSTTETVPLNDVIETNSTLNNDNPQNKNDDPAGSKIDVNKTEQFNESSQSDSTNNIENEPQIYEDSIRIRLKYLNDNCRLVQGRLQENVGVFKRRHFTNELASNKIIRLIFQGKVLHDDEASLSSCGLHDNCVVHCLIHQPRPTTNAQQTPDPVNHDTNEQPLPNVIRHGQRQPGPVQREWNLATLLSALITIIISLLWYARIQFYTFFSYTSTGTLGILTGIFLFTAFLTYLVDNEEQQHHRPQAGH